MLEYVWILTPAESLALVSATLQEFETKVPQMRISTLLSSNVVWNVRGRNGDDDDVPHILQNNLAKAYPFSLHYCFFSQRQPRITDDSQDSSFTTAFLRLQPRGHHQLLSPKLSPSSGAFSREEVNNVFSKNGYGWLRHFMKMREF